MLHRTLILYRYLETTQAMENDQDIWNLEFQESLPFGFFENSIKRICRI
jgi:hypothetical protein